MAEPATRRVLAATFMGAAGGGGEAACSCATHGGSGGASSCAQQPSQQSAAPRHSLWSVATTAAAAHALADAGARHAQLRAHVLSTPSEQRTHSDLLLIDELLQQSRALVVLPRAARLELARAARLVVLPAGAAAVQQGECVDRLLVVVSGQVCVQARGGVSQWCSGARECERLCIRPLHVCAQPWRSASARMPLQLERLAPGEAATDASPAAAPAAANAAATPPAAECQSEAPKLLGPGSVLGAERLACSCSCDVATLSSAGRGSSAATIAATAAAATSAAGECASRAAAQGAGTWPCTVVAAVASECAEVALSPELLQVLAAVRGRAGGTAGIAAFLRAQVPALAWLPERQLVALACNMESRLYSHNEVCGLVMQCRGWG